MSFRLSRVIQGIEFDYPTSHGTIGRALVLAEALTTRFGCSDDPESWCKAFQDNRSALEAEAVRLDEETLDVTRFVIIRASSAVTHHPAAPTSLLQQSRKTGHLPAASAGPDTGLTR